MENKEQRIAELEKALQEAIEYMGWIGCSYECYNEMMAEVEQAIARLSKVACNTTEQEQASR